MTSPWCHDSYAPSFVINGPKFAKLFNRITAIIPLDFSPISRSQELKLTKLAVLPNTLVQRCTSWRHQMGSWVQTLGIYQRGIMCLLVGVPVEVQFPCWEVPRQLLFSSSFCGCSSATLEPPDHENTCRKWRFAMGILMVRWLESCWATTTKRRAKNKLPVHLPARELNLDGHTNQEAHDTPLVHTLGSNTGPHLMTLRGALLGQCV